MPRKRSASFRVLPQVAVDIELARYPRAPEPELGPLVDDGARGASTVAAIMVQALLPLVRK